MNLKRSLNRFLRKCNLRKSVKWRLNACSNMNRDYVDENYNVSSYTFQRKQLQARKANLVNVVS